MGQRRLPPEAFETYVSLGPGRSYAKVAEEYGVSKRTVTRAADHENWQERLAAVEARARAQADEKAAGHAAAGNPQGRLIDPEEVASVVAWLALPEQVSMTGQAIAVAGGEVT